MRSRAKRVRTGRAWRCGVLTQGATIRVSGSCYDPHCIGKVDACQYAAPRVWGSSSRQVTGI